MTEYTHKISETKPPQGERAKTIQLAAYELAKGYAEYHSAAKRKDPKKLSALEQQLDRLIKKTKE